MTVFTACKGQTEQKSDLSLTFLPDEVLKTRSKEELRLLRNEVYARKGYIFKSVNLNEYFKTKSWYKPKSGNKLTFTSQESKYISKIKDLENNTNESTVNCINYYHRAVSKIYPLSGIKIKNEELPEGLIDIELNHIELNPEIRKVLFDGSIFNIDCNTDNTYKLIITYYPNQNLRTYLVAKNKLEVKKLYGSFGPYENHQEYNFVLDHQDLEVTIEDWQRDQKINTRVEKYKLTDNGLLKL